MRHHAQAEAAPANEGAAAREEEERWRRWTDERFVRLITVNIYRSMRESFQMFDYIANTGGCPTVLLEHCIYTQPFCQGVNLVLI